MVGFDPVISLFLTNTKLFRTKKKKKNHAVTFWRSSHVYEQVSYLIFVGIILYTLTAPHRFGHFHATLKTSTKPDNCRGIESHDLALFFISPP